MLVLFPLWKSRFTVGGTKGYIRAGMYPDGTLGEIFVTVAKEGSTLSGVMDCFAVLVSLALQSGIPLGTLVNKFRYVRFSPDGLTGNKEIPMASSILDYIFRWLELRFLSGAPIFGFLLRRRLQSRFISVLKVGLPQTAVLSFLERRLKKALTTFAISFSENNTMEVLLRLSCSRPPSLKHLARKINSPHRS